MKKRILSLALALVMVLSLIGFTAPRASAEWNNNWTYGQNVAHEVADTVRGLGGKIAAFLAAAGSYWFSQGGRNIDDDFYYDATNNLTTYADGRTQKGIGGCQGNLPQAFYVASDGNIVYNNGLTYTDPNGQFTWFWSQARSQYFRYTDENGSKKYDGLRTRYPATYNGNYGNGNGYNGDNGGNSGNSGNNYSIYARTQYTSNANGYNYSYHGVKLYAGLITGLESYISRTKAENLARFALGHANGQPDSDMTAACWMGVNYSQQCNFNTAEARSYYPKYDPNANLNTTEGKRALERAYDVLLRLEAENSGMTYVGRTLPKGHTYYSIESSGAISFRDTPNGNFYTFPDYSSSAKTQYHSPY